MSRSTTRSRHLSIFLAGSAAFAAAALSSRVAQAAITADSYSNYVPGETTFNGSDDSTYQTTLSPQAALGPMNPDTGYGSVTPFNPAYATSDIMIIGGNGQLTLHLSAPVTAIGVISNNGIDDADTTNGTGQAPSNLNDSDLFSPPSMAVVKVSSDGVSWRTLSTGTAITFDQPGNYWADGPALSYDYQSPGTIPANQDQPWYVPGTTQYGTLASLSGMSYSEMLSTFDGSAGGTWLDTGAPISYVQFDVPDGDRMVIDSIGGVAAPEPISGSILLIAGSGLLLRRRPNA